MWGGHQTSFWGSSWSQVLSQEDPFFLAQEEPEPLPPADVFFLSRSSTMGLRLGGLSTRRAEACRPQLGFGVIRSPERRPFPLWREERQEECQYGQEAQEELEDSIEEVFEDALEYVDDGSNKNQEDSTLVSKDQIDVEDPGLDCLEDQVVEKEQTVIEIKEKEAPKANHEKGTVNQDKDPDFNQETISKKIQRKATKKVPEAVLTKDDQEEQTSETEAVPEDLGDDARSSLDTLLDYFAGLTLTGENVSATVSTEAKTAKVKRKSKAVPVVNTRKSVKLKFVSEAQLIGKSVSDLTPKQRTKVARATEQRKLEEVVKRVMFLPLARKVSMGGTEEETPASLEEGESRHRLHLQARLASIRETGC